MDGIYLGDALNLPLPNGSVHLVVTSPPYNVGKEYEETLTTEEYIYTFTHNWIQECGRVLVDGGRLCINIANTGRKPYVDLRSMIARIAEPLEFLERGEIIWDKGDAVARGKTTWGSWCKPSNPVIRDEHEYILVYSKKDYNLVCDGYGASDITPKEFSDNTLSVWNIAPAPKISWHQCPFPEEIPRRLIKLYTAPGMVVLDCFSGSGTTCRVAKSLGRHYIGFDKERKYVNLSNRLLGGGLFQ